MEFGSIFTYPYTVDFRDCGPDGCFRLSGWMELMGKTAERHYELLGLSYRRMIECREVFLLSRYDFRFFDRFPVEGDCLTVSTREIGSEGASALRDFTVVLEEKEIASVRSRWVIYNPDTRKIIRPSEMTTRHFPKNPEPDKPEKLMPLPEETPVGERRVVYSDLDSNGHMTNSRYGDVTMDFLPACFRGRTPSAFSVRFMKECMEGEILQIGSLCSENSVLLSGSAGGTDRFVSRITFAD